MHNSVSAKHVGLSLSENNVFSQEILDSHCLGTVWPLDMKISLDLLLFYDYSTTNTNAK